MFLRFPYRATRIGLVGAVVAGASLLPPAARPAQAAVQCRPAGPLVRVPDLPEGSGLAASLRTPGRFWALNDSGAPVLVALDENGRVAGRLRIDGAAVEDWESLAVGRCPSGSCIYVADIGDNDAERDRITIYRIPEPGEASGSVAVSGVFHAAYPDGAHDAESLLVTGDGRLYIVTKGETGPVSIYRFPHELRSGTTLRLERVGEPRDTRRAAEADRVTDGAVSPDGDWIVLRSIRTLAFYRTADLLAGNWREAARVPLAALEEPQGEGVTFGAEAAIYLISEGGNKKRPGAFGRLTCTLNP